MTEPKMVERVKVAILDCEAAGPITPSAARVVARAAIAAHEAALAEEGMVVMPVKSKPAPPPLWTIEYEKMIDGEWRRGTAQYDSEFIAKEMAADIVRAPGHRMIRVVPPAAALQEET